MKLLHRIIGVEDLLDDLGRMLAEPDVDVDELAVLISRFDDASALLSAALNQRLRGLRPKPDLELVRGGPDVA